MRKAAHEGFNKGMVKNYQVVQALEAVLLASDVVEDPQSYNKHYRRAGASMVLSIIYDLPTVRSEEDINLKRIDAHIERLVKGSAPHLVDAIPWLEYVPSRSVNQFAFMAYPFRTIDTMKTG